MSIFAILLLPMALMEHSCDGRHSSSHLGAQSHFEDELSHVGARKERP